MDLSQFKINNFVTIIVIGSDTVKNKLYNLSIMKQASLYMSNIDVRIIKCPSNMIMNLWNVQYDITNQNDKI